MANRFFTNLPYVPYHFTRDGTNNPIVTANIMRRFGIRAEIKNNADFYYMYHTGETDTPEILAHKLYGDANLWWIVMMANDIVDPNYDWPLSNAKFDRWLAKKYPGEAFFLWTISGNFEAGETVSSPSSAEREVHKWDRTYQRLEVMPETDDTGYWAIGNIVTGQSSGATGILSRRVQQNIDALHHFSEDGSSDSDWVDPWDPTENYLNGYINSSIDTYAVTNYSHHYNKNEAKREIKLIKPEYINAIIEHAESIVK